MNQAKTSKMWTVEGLRDMSYDDFVSVLTQLLDNPDISEKIAFLDIGEIYSVVDLADKHVQVLLYQKINTRRQI